MPNHQARESLSRDKIPFYVELVEELKYNWLEPFIGWESRLIQINRLNKELAEVKKADPVFSEFAERVRASYGSYRGKRIEVIAKYLFKQLHSPDPLTRFHRAMAPAALDVLEVDVLEEALAFIEKNYAGGITAADKAKQIATIEKKIGKLQNEMLELLPPDKFTTRDPQSGKEINKAECFVDHWRELATWTIGPVSPRGRALSMSTKEEQAAYHSLGFAGLTSRAARLEPYSE